MGRIYDLFISKYNYTDFHELNLDWLIAAVKQFEYEMENFVAINAVKYADPIQWDITRQYEKNTIVIDPITGTAYISVKAVPMGVDISRTDYWKVVFDLGRFITMTAQNFANSYEPLPTLTATITTPKDGWVVWDSTLYKALNDIDIGDKYVPDGNIVKSTVEDFFNTEAQTRADEDTRIELSLTDLINSKVGVEAQTRADEDTRIELELTDLITSKVDIEARTRADEDARIELNLTDLINSQISIVESKMVSIYDISKHGAVADGVTDNTAIIQAGIDSGMIVLIPKGKWATRQLELKYGTHIMGVTDGWTTDNGSVLVSLDDSGSVLHVPIARNKVVIENIGIYGSATSTSVDGIKIDGGVSDYYIHKVMVMRCRHGFNLGWCGWATVDTCFAEQNYIDGFHLENGATDGEQPLQINVLNCLSEHNGENGFRWINNNPTTSAPAGSMINCATYKNSGRGCMYYNKFTAVRVNTCFFGDDGLSELYFYGETAGFPATVTNCQFELCGQSATGPDNATPATNNGIGVSIAGNSRVLLNNCFISGSSSYGIYAQDSNITLNSCKLLNNALATGRNAQIYLNNCRSIILGNTLQGATKIGIYFSNNTNIANIANNSFEAYTTAIDNTAGATKVYTSNNIASDGTLLT